MGIWNIGVFISFVIPVNIKGKHVRPIRGSALVHITCAIISSDQILYLEQVKDEPPRNPLTVFRFRVRALFECQNR